MALISLCGCKQISRPIISQIEKLTTGGLFCLPISGVPFRGGRSPEVGVFIVPLRGSYERMDQDFQYVDLDEKSIDELAEIFALCDEHGTRALAEQVLAEIERRACNPPRTQHNLPGWFPAVFWHQKPVGEGRAR